MNILEEFWYGNIEPAEYDISPSKEYKELLQLISRNEDKLGNIFLACSVFMDNSRAWNAFRNFRLILVGCGLSELPKVLILLQKTRRC